MDSISASVGHQATNRMPDVRTVQALLNRHTPRLGVAPLSVDGNAGPRTVAAIKLFQQKVAGMALADGRVDPAGRTWRQLAGANPAKLSGAAWWHANQAKFPNSADVATLDAGFKAKADKFLAAMRAGGLKVQVRSTRRNKVRAYLMHYSWKIAKGMVPPDKVPPEPGCDIIWDHGNLGA
jgi:peptidoglycan hydrolase-like protein with peptidoglycan-binding domain